MRHTVHTCLTSGIKHIDLLDAELILAFVMHHNREYIIAHSNQPVSFITYIRYNVLVRQRANGLPLAYITGHKEFYGLDFIVNKHTLIPRPDTEVLVETAVEAIKEHLVTATARFRQGGTINNEQCLLIDIGTGSGCIPIAIYKTIEQYNDITITAFATDISRPALRTAKRNAKKHRTPITFFHGSLLSPITHLVTRTYNLAASIIITANLPYLTQEQFDEESSIQHEPHTALVANNGGLALYEELLQQIKELAINNEQLTIRCFFEIDPSQSSRITSLIQSHIPAARIEIKKDLDGQDRVVCVELT